MLPQQFTPPEPARAADIACTAGLVNTCFELAAWLRARAFMNVARLQTNVCLLQWLGAYACPVLSTDTAYSCPAG